MLSYFLVVENFMSQHNNLTSWLTREQSGRKKRVSVKNLLLSVGGPCLLIFIILWCLSNYTGWINLREYDSKTDTIRKTWIPNVEWLKKSFNEYLIRHNTFAVHNVLFATSPPALSQIPTIRLFLRNNSLEELNQGILKFYFGELSKKNKVKGFYESTSGEHIPIKINLRGTMSDHHQVWKPSIRIRFPKSKLQNGYKNHVLVAPENALGLRNWLSNYLSGKWNMLNLKEHFVRLFINNKFFGVYNRIWRLDESLLIQSKTLPGPFFRLEPKNKGLFYIGNFLFWNNPEGWESIGVQKAHGLKIIERFVSASQHVLNWNSKESLLKAIPILDEYLDKDIFAKYLAILCHSGERHVDGQHNNALWLDTTSGKIVPILMDVSGYNWDSLDSKDLERPILKMDPGYIAAWLMNPNNLALYIDRLYELINSFGSAKKLDKRIRSQWIKIKGDIRSDINLSKSGYAGREYFSFRKSEENIKYLIKFIYEREEWIRDQLFSDSISVVDKRQNEFDVFIEGFSGVLAKKIDGQNFFINNSEHSIFAKLLPSMNEPSLSKYFGTSRSYAFFTLSGKPDDFVFTHRLMELKFIFPVLQKI